MKAVYYIINADDALTLGLAEIRRGNNEEGYVVNAGDLVTAPEEIKDRARLVSEREAIEFINKL